MESEEIRVLIFLNIIRIPFILILRPHISLYSWKSQMQKTRMRIVFGSKIVFTFSMLKHEQICVTGVFSFCYDVAKRRCFNPPKWHRNALLGGLHEIIYFKEWHLYMNERRFIDLKSKIRYKRNKCLPFFPRRPNHPSGPKRIPFCWRVWRASSRMVRVWLRIQNPQEVLHLCSPPDRAPGWNQPRSTSIIGSAPIMLSVFSCAFCAFDTFWLV